jgi:hypothetical protein
VSVRHRASRGIAPQAGPARHHRSDVLRVTVGAPLSPNRGTTVSQAPGQALTYAPIDCGIRLKRVLEEGTEKLEGVGGRSHHSDRSFVSKARRQVSSSAAFERIGQVAPAPTHQNGRHVAGPSIPPYVLHRHAEDGSGGATAETGTCAERAAVGVDPAGRSHFRTPLPRISRITASMC